MCRSPCSVHLSQGNSHLAYYYKLYSIVLQSNIRDDAYSAKHAPLHLLQRIVTSIRKVLPRPFVLGIKLSSSDYVGAGSLHEAQVEQEAEDMALSHIVDIACWDMIEFIEISGGDYENPGATCAWLHFLVTH